MHKLLLSITCTVLCLPVLMNAASEGSSKKEDQYPLHTLVVKHIGNSPEEIAAYTKELQDLINQNPGALLQKNEQGDTPLLHIMRFGFNNAKNKVALTGNIISPFVLLKQKNASEFINIKNQQGKTAFCDLFDVVASEASLNAEKNNRLLSTQHLDFIKKLDEDNMTNENAIQYLLTVAPGLIDFAHRRYLTKKYPRQVDNLLVNMLIVGADSTLCNYSKQEAKQELNRILREYRNQLEPQVRESAASALGFASNRSGGDPMDIMLSYLLPEEEAKEQAQAKSTKEPTKK